ncbi:MAG: Flp pilus assembly complex ATPase component TadA [Candidatus Gastranaerophilales bacterium]|nr:Flp pilus assembly complex ATPase component TadA [Candidatus Gastranaerophilales bacterium]
MSLKDRLNTIQKQIAPKIQQEQPKYYNTNNEAQLDSLGALDTLLADDDLNSIFVSGAKNIYIERKGKTHKSTTTFRDNVQLENILKKIAQNEGIELNEFNPYFEFNYKEGVSATATLPPLSNVATLFLKCYKDKHASLQTLQVEHSISKEIALVLEALCSIKKNILIVGEKNTLKTTLLSALAKKIPTNNRAVIFDCENEFKIQTQNHTNYNFSKIDDSKKAAHLFNLVVDSNPDKIFINTKEEEFLCDVIKKIKSGYKGVVATLRAENPKNAVEKLTQILIDNNPNLTFQNAKSTILNTFDIIIAIQKDELGRRKITSISEIYPLSENNYIKNIFSVDYLYQHKSEGITPLFYEDIKNNSLPIGDNIFSEDYKHTYHKGIDIDAQFAKKGANIDILKKFKKDLPTPNNEEKVQTEEPIQKEQEALKEEKQEMSQEELMQKAQEKFDELKKNVQMQGDFEIKLEDFEDNNDENV